MAENILVIGGSGFMGSHTADELSNRGFNVTIFDQTKSPWLKSNQKMISGDIMDTEALSEAMRGVNYVSHYAGIADIEEAQAQPYHTIETNIRGLTKALDVAVECNIQQFIYASTIYVYSNHGSFYRASKQAAEIIIEAYHDDLGIIWPSTVSPFQLSLVNLMPENKMCFEISNWITFPLILSNLS